MKTRYYSRHAQVYNVTKYSIKPILGYAIWIIVLYAIVLLYTV